MLNKSKFSKIFWNPILTGIFIGVIAPILTKLGNPGNMGICVACFTRDTAGALGLHRASLVQYIRPEIIGLVLGAFVSAILFREFKPKTGSSPLIRLLLGAFSMIGALVFLGCPWRTYLRLSGGDLNSLAGLIGLVGGILLGLIFLKRGFSLGRSRPTPKVVGLIIPLLMVGLLMLLIIAPQFGRDADGNPVGPIFFSSKGPGSMHSPLLVSLIAGSIIGFLAQRSRFCTIGAIRDAILFKSPRFLYGLLALLITAFLTNLFLGQFKLGFTGQPIAHFNTIWNFAGMVLSGLAFTLAGGCPGRQLFLTGEGDGDAGIFVMGMFLGTAFAHNFNLASSSSGPSIYGPIAVLVGLAICTMIGLTLREPVG